MRISRRIILIGLPCLIFFRLFISFVESLTLVFKKSEAAVG